MWRSWGCLYFLAFWWDLYQWLTQQPYAGDQVRQRPRFDLLDGASPDCRYHVCVCVFKCLIMCNCTVLSV
jgi:hypothetical protein